MATKYQPLVAHLNGATPKAVTLQFADVEKLLGAPLPASANKYQAWWANSSENDSHTWAHAWQAAGWKVDHLDLAGQKVTFRRIRTQEGTGKSNTDKELTALALLGGSATLAEVHGQLVKTHGQFDDENLRKDFIMLSVNDEKRFAYRAWKTRKGIATSALDRVFDRGGKGEQRRYELYDPSLHGIWEVYQKPTGGPGLRLAGAADEAPVLAAGAGLEYDPQNDNDAKEKALRSIAVRRGAPQFRQALLAAYGGRCCVSGCTTAAVLEAAHIRPYQGKATNDATNGLLLRSDIHTLLDLGLLAIDPATLCVNLHPKVRSDPHYAHLHGKKLDVGSGKPSGKALLYRWEWQMSWKD